MGNVNTDPKIQKPMSKSMKKLILTDKKDIKVTFLQNRNEDVERIKRKLIDDTEN